MIPQQLTAASNYQRCFQRTCLSLHPGEVVATVLGLTVWSSIRVRAGTWLWYFFSPTAVSCSVTLGSGEIPLRNLHRAQNFWTTLLDSGPWNKHPADTQSVRQQQPSCWHRAGVNFSFFNLWSYVCAQGRSHTHTCCCMLCVCHCMTTCQLGYLSICLSPWRQPSCWKH